ncbi:hypothetical protein PFISCL1PPCAC_28401, partial [Pristionchus fissidentatus]
MTTRNKTSFWLSRNITILFSNQTMNLVSVLFCFEFYVLKNLASVYYRTVKSLIALTLILIASPLVFVVVFILRHLTLCELRKRVDTSKVCTQTLNIQLALTTFLGIGSVLYFADLMGWLRHPLLEVAPVARAKYVQIVNLLPCLAPIFNLFCIKPYR